jgi:hypothetical protein
MNVHSAVGRGRPVVRISDNSVRWPDGLGSPPDLLVGGRRPDGLATMPIRFASDADGARALDAMNAAASRRGGPPELARLLALVHIARDGRELIVDVEAGMSAEAVELGNKPATRALAALQR